MCSGIGAADDLVPEKRNLSKRRSGEDRRFASQDSLEAAVPATDLKKGPGEDVIADRLFAGNAPN
jgi:hypothetical protein